MEFSLRVPLTQWSLSSHRAASYRGSSFLRGTHQDQTSRNKVHRKLLRQSNVPFWNYFRPAATDINIHAISGYVAQRFLLFFATPSREIRVTLLKIERLLPKIYFITHFTKFTILFFINSTFCFFSLSLSYLHNLIRTRDPRKSIVLPIAYLCQLVMIRNRLARG